MKLACFCVWLGGVLWGMAVGTPAGAAEAGKPARHEVVVARGLDWLASHQSEKGYWAAVGDQYPTAITALAGIALLSEGSTASQGKYAPNLRRAVDYLVRNSRPDGLIGRAPDPQGLPFRLPPKVEKPKLEKPTEFEDTRYIFGHGYAMLFLSQVLAVEKDAGRRAKLADVLKRAAAFSKEAQTRNGGWGYVSAKDGRDFDEGAATAALLDGLSACRAAGVEVPGETVEKAFGYLQRCTLSNGGIIYSLQSGGSGARPAITAAAAGCLQQAGEPQRERLEKLLKFCEAQVGLKPDQTTGHWHYAHFSYARVRYRQGGRLWDDYRNTVYPDLAAKAGENGDWNQGYVGPAYTTAVNLAILQLEKAAVPAFRR